MANLIHIDQKDLQRLNMNMAEFRRELQAVCKQALANIGARIIANAQTTLRRKQNVATGVLVNSGSVKEGRDNSIMAGFPTAYAYFVEFGRKAGKWPPFEAIYQWVRVTHLTSDPNEEKSLAFLIQRSIGQNGTKPHPFLRPAYEKNKPLIINVLKKGAAKIFNKDYTR